MTPEKRTAAPARSATTPPPAPPSAPTPSKRKAWTPKSTIEVVLEQIGKQEKKVAEMQKAVDAEKTTLNKLLRAKKVLESE